MNEDAFFQTETMADVWRKQGRYAEAIRIYAALLEREPGRSDLGQKLADTQREYELQEPVGIRTERLLRQWIEARLCLGRISDIQAIRQGWVRQDNPMTPSGRLETETTESHAYETIRHRSVTAQ